MKITLHVDDKLLREAMSVTGIKSKTGTIDFALRELTRRHTLRTLLEINLGFTDEEIINAFDPAYDVLSSRVAETPGTPGAL